MLTQRRYLMDLKHFFEFIADKFQKTITSLEIKDLELITPNDIKSYLATLEKFTIGYRKNILCALNMFFLFFKKQGLITDNIVECVDRPELPEKPIIYLTADETHRLLSAVNNDVRSAAGINKLSPKQLLRDKTIITLFLSTGIRLSELIGLNRENVNMDNASITIRRSKSGRYETVYMTNELHNQLNLYFQDNKLQNESPLFISNKGQRMQPNSIEIMLKKYVKLAGIDKRITPHKLRATFGTSIYRNTHDIYLTAKLLGHNSVNTTTKYYVDMDEQTKRFAINNFHIA